MSDVRIQPPWTTELDDLRDRVAALERHLLTQHKAQTSATLAYAEDKLAAADEKLARADAMAAAAAHCSEIVGQARSDSEPSPAAEWLESLEPFVHAMADRLAVKQAEGFEGWDDPEYEDAIRDRFIRAYAGGRFVDIANLAWMLWRFEQERGS